ncbi:hypothetical protein BCT06_13675 [Vibrio breoganii]|uniref:flippase n=1 Tax=Vibrio breoganii TaxID=553239 RepID=UPI000C860949|nr:flippase [Vibrio breoganii]PMO59955.1 hypothetical protein BCT06_13675 [Vibrio breoganii]
MVNLRIIKNITWLLFDKLFRITVGMFVFVYMARSLDVEGIGLYSFIISFSVLLNAVANFGLKNQIIKDLVFYKRSVSRIINSAIVFRVSLGFIIYGLVVIYSSLFDSVSEDSYLLLVASASVILSSSDVIKYLYEAKVRYKIVVLIENFSFILCSFGRFYAIIRGFDVEIFVYIYVLEILLTTITLYTIQFKKRILKFTVINKRYIKKLFFNCLPLVVSSISWIAYTRSDQLMLKYISGVESVGLYSVALKLSDAIILIPSILVTTMIPIISKVRPKNKILYENKIKNLYGFTLTISMLLSFIICFMSSTVVNILYGVAFIESATVLNIMVWCSLFYSMATISGRYLVNEGLQKYTMYRHLSALGLNILLNLILIPLYNEVGAAVSSLISLISANYFFDLINRKTRVCFYHKTFGLLYIPLKSIEFVGKLGVRK